MATLGVAIAIIQAGRVLLTKRDDFHVWCLPGGAVDNHESLADSALREAREETGLELELGRLVGMYSQPNWEGGSNHLAVFAAVPAGGALRLALGETVDVGYFGRGELPHPLVAWHRQPLEDALDGLGGVVRSIAYDWPFAPHLTRREVYALRDQSGLTRQRFYLQHFERANPGSAAGEAE